MNKNSKITFIIATSAILTVWWAVLIFAKIQGQTVNYLWQAGLALLTIVYAIMGILESKHWSWLKSDVGKAVFFISLGLIFWGLGQTGWTYFTLMQPEVESPKAPILDFLYFASVPIWTYGIFQLSKATGAKYGFRKLSGKIFAAIAFILLGVVSYYLLVVVARGGPTAYFDTSALPEDSLPMWWIAFSDLGYATGDAINLILSFTIFGLSWKYLGGKFKKPILALLSAFVLMYIADLFFSYYDGKGEYFNGHWVDLVYLVTIAVFGIALCMMDPTSSLKIAPKQPSENENSIVPNNQQDFVNEHVNISQPSTNSAVIEPNNVAVSVGENKNE